MMRRKAVEVGDHPELEQFKDCFCSNIPWSDRLDWVESLKEKPSIEYPSLLAICVVREDGQPVMDLQGWNEFFGDYQNAGGSLYGQCTNVVGNREAAKKP